MGQYYKPYIKNGKKIKVFDNRIDGEWEGLKLMEHSYFGNRYVGQVVNELYYQKCNVCWVGDYYNEDDYSQINCDKETVRTIGDLVWNDKTKLIKGSIHTSRRLFKCLLVNHTKKVYINCDKFYNANKWLEQWKNEEYYMCVNPLPLLTCSASHSGGAYYGVNSDKCGIWFNDLLEVVDNEQWEIKGLIEKGYSEFEIEFREN